MPENENSVRTWKHMCLEPEKGELGGHGNGLCGGASQGERMWGERRPARWGEPGSMTRRGSALKARERQQLILSRGLT